MLRNLLLRAVGPAKEMDVAFADRLNIITGDNGLGKSFLLDIAWWALTRTWAGQPALPQRFTRAAPRIVCRFDGKRGQVEEDSVFIRQTQQWKRQMGRPSIPGLVLYAQVDGGFSVWDPARNYWKQTKGEYDPSRPKSFIFKPHEVWEGLPHEDSFKMVCNGLIADWASWQREDGEAFHQLRRVLEALSPSEEEVIRPGPLTRISVDDARDFPTIQMLYGQNVPVIHASAGMRRIIALAYLLVWSWREHVIASEILGSRPAHQIIFLIDEIESHLHPKWQRQVFDAILKVMDALVGQHKVENIQIIAATHSPLIMASIEPFFDPNIDAWFDIDQSNNRVAIRHRDFEKLGTSDEWLMSEAFGLPIGRSIPYEKLIEEASDLIDRDQVDLEEIKRVNDALVNALSPRDPFLFSWRYICQKREWLN